MEITSDTSGAHPENLLSDLEKIGITNQIKLEESFRNVKKTSVAKLSSATEEANYIAHQFRSAYLKDGLPWSQMAVILRSPGSQVSALQRAFAINNVPVEIDGRCNLPPLLHCLTLQLRFF